MPFLLPAHVRRRRRRTTEGTLYELVLGLPPVSPMAPTQPEHSSVPDGAPESTGGASGPPPSAHGSYEKDERGESRPAWTRRRRRREGPVPARERRRSVCRRRCRSTARSWSGQFDVRGVRPDPTFPTFFSGIVPSRSQNIPDRVRARTALFVVCFWVGFGRGSYVRRCDGSAFVAGWLFVPGFRVRFRWVCGGLRVFAGLSLWRFGWSRGSCGSGSRGSFFSCAAGLSAVGRVWLFRGWSLFWGSGCVRVFWAVVRSWSSVASWVRLSGCLSVRFWAVVPRSAPVVCFWGFGSLSVLFFGRGRGFGSYAGGRGVRCSGWWQARSVTGWVVGQGASGDGRR